MPVITSKPFFTYQQQIDLLKARGLIIQDESKAISTLRDISYYRLSAYSLTLRTDDIFHDGTNFDDIVNLYHFDDRLRLIVLRFALCVENSMGAHISYHHSQKYGPLGYTNNQNFKDVMLHAAFLNRLSQKLERSAEPAILHHKKDLDNTYPLWVAMEAMSFDMISKFYKNMRTADKKSISGEYNGNRNLHHHVESWLHCCVNIRNIAAHGSRLYNRLLPVKVRCKRGDSEKFHSNSPFACAYAIFFLLPFDEQKRLFKSLLKDLFLAFPKADKGKLGFPDDWEAILTV